MDTYKLQMYKKKCSSRLNNVTLTIDSIIFSSTVAGDNPLIFKKNTFFELYFEMLNLERAIQFQLNIVVPFQEIFRKAKSAFFTILP